MMGGPGMHGGPGRGMGGRMEGGPRDVMNPDVIEALASEVGVDQAVLAKIKTLVYNANREAIDLRAEVQRERLTLRQLLDDPQPDSKKVLKQVENVGAAETKIRKNRVQLILQVRELLTPEQRQKLQHLVAERGGHGRGGPGWFGPAGED
jgi:Spy/CpxP family protein refolding chaperone